MLKVTIGFIIGAIIGAAAAFICTVVYTEVDSHQAFRDGQISVGLKVPAALGRDVDPKEPMEVFSSVESESVVVVTRRGVKTLRLCCDGTEPKPTP